MITMIFIYMKLIRMVFFIRNNRKLSLSKVKLISFDDIYCNDLEHLIENSNLSNWKPGNMYFQKGRNNHEGFVNKYIDKHEIVSLFIEDDYVIGEIQEQNKSYILINNYTYQGFKDGNTLIAKESIYKIRFRSAIERRVELLRKWKN